MKSKLFFLLFLNTLLFADGPVQEVYKDLFVPLKENKVMVIAINQDTGRWAYSMVGKAPSITSAQNVTMKRCKELIKKKKLKAQCRVYAINKKIIGETY